MRLLPVEHVLQDQPTPLLFFFKGPPFDPEPAIGVVCRARFQAEGQAPFMGVPI